MTKDLRPIDERLVATEWYLLRDGDVKLVIVIPLERRKMLIGRNTNLHLRIAPHVSRKHFLLKKRRGVWYIRDLNSTCGLYINKVKIKPDTDFRINDGDIIGLGVPRVRKETDFEFILCRKIHNTRTNITPLPEPKSVPVADFSGYVKKREEHMKSRSIRERERLLDDVAVKEEKARNDENMTDQLLSDGKGNLIESVEQVQQQGIKRSSLEESSTDCFIPDAAYEKKLDGVGTNTNNEDSANTKSLSDRCCNKEDLVKQNLIISLKKQLEKFLSQENETSKVSSVQKSKEKSTKRKKYKRIQKYSSSEDENIETNEENSLKSEQKRVPLDKKLNKRKMENNKIGSDLSCISDRKHNPCKRIKKCSDSKENRKPISLPVSLKFSYGFVVHKSELKLRNDKHCEMKNKTKTEKLTCIVENSQCISENLTNGPGKERKFSGLEETDETDFPSFAEICKLPKHLKKQFEDASKAALADNCKKVCNLGDSITKLDSSAYIIQEKVSTQQKYNEVKMESSSKILGDYLTLVQQIWHVNDTGKCLNSRNSVRPTIGKCVQSNCVVKCDGNGANNDKTNHGTNIQTENLLTPLKTENNSDLNHKAIKLYECGKTRKQTSTVGTVSRNTIIEKILEEMKDEQKQVFQNPLYLSQFLQCHGNDPTLNMVSSVFKHLETSLLSSTFLSVKHSAEEMSAASKKLLSIVINWNIQENSFPQSIDLKSMQQSAALSYSRFDKYFDTYFNLLLVEMIEFIKLSFLNKEPHFKSAVDDVLLADDVSSFTCHMSGENGPLNTDLVYINNVINRGEIDEGNFPGLGFISEVNYKPVDNPNCSKSDYFEIQFTIQVKNWKQNVTKGSRINIFVICNIYHFLQQFEALESLKSSVLLKDILVPNVTCCKIETSNHIVFKSCRNYNSCQKKAVLNICSSLLHPKSNRIILLQCPPGTGKMQCVVGIIEQMLNKRKDTKILVVSPSEASAFKVALDLSKIKMKESQFIYIGQHKNDSSKLKCCYLKQHINAGVENISGKGTAEPIDVMTRLTSANVVLVTLAMCQKRILEPLLSKFSFCIFDEATQCTEPQTLIPLKCAITKLVLIGDPQQPSVRLISKTALGMSLFERFYKSFEQTKEKELVIVLSKQYRIHPDIISFPSSYFYSNRLQSYSYLKEIPIRPYCVFNFINDKASGQIASKMQFIEALRNEISNLVSPNVTLAIVTCTLEEKHTVQKMFSKGKWKHLSPVYQIRDYNIPTKDVIIFMYSVMEKDEKLLNFTLTRACSSMVLCGSIPVMPETQGFWHHLTKDASKRNVLFEISLSCPSSACQLIRNDFCGDATTNSLAQSAV